MSQKQTFREAIETLGGGTELLDVVVAQAPFGVYLDQVKRGCVYANPALLEQFGIPWEDFQGFGWARFIHAEDATALTAAIHEYEHRLQPIYVRYRVLRPDGQTFWIYARVRALVDTQGHHLGSVGVTEDITEQRKFRDRAATTQKLEAIGRLSGRIAHDFNNLLGVMLGATELLARGVHGDRNRKNLTMIGDAIEQARQITNQLLALSPARTAARTPTRLDAALEQLEPLLRRTLGEGVELTIARAAGDACVFLDPGQFGQIVINLATNARDAMEGRGHLSVASERLQGRVRLAVQDEGTGMSPEVASRAAEPFFTTKDPGRGTGLGLSTVNDLIALAGGELSIDSEPGRGTRISIEFPLAEGDFAPQAEERTAPEVVSGDGAVVLFVEDHDALRQSLGYALAMSGFRVLPAARVEDALEIVRGQPIDAVVTDVLLPDGEGPEIVREARGIKPGIPVVYVSGYPGRAAREMHLEEPATLFLEKPFRPEQLCEAVVRVLRSARGTE